MRVAPTRPFSPVTAISIFAVFPSEGADPVGHVQCRLGGFLTSVADVAARAGPRLLLGEGGDEPEGGGDARGKRNLTDAGGRLTRDVLEMRRLATDHDAHADDPREASGPSQMICRQRELERAWDPMELDSVFAEPRRLERFPGAADQALGDALVETRRDDREPGRCGTYRCPAELGSATGHLSPEVTTTGARACRAWC